VSFGFRPSYYAPSFCAKKAQSFQASNFGSQFLIFAQGGDPDGRGRRVATDVRGHPVANRPTGTARASMTGVEVGCDR
jgi:hypothetical protein